MEEQHVTFGQQIAELRRKENISTRKLAEMCGISFQFLNKIENGKFNTGINTICKICDALGYRLVIEPK